MQDATHGVGQKEKGHSSAPSVEEAIDRTESVSDQRHIKIRPTRSLDKSESFFEQLKRIQKHERATENIRAVPT